MKKFATVAILSIFLIPSVFASETISTVLGVLNAIHCNGSLKFKEKLYSFKVKPIVPDVKTVTIHVAGLKDFDFVLDIFKPTSKSVLNFIRGLPLEKPLSFSLHLKDKYTNRISSAVTGGALYLSYNKGKLGEETERHRPEPVSLTVQWTEYEQTVGTLFCDGFYSQQILTWDLPDEKDSPSMSYGGSSSDNYHF